MKQQIIDLIQNQINEIGNRHDIYSKGEVQKVLVGLLAEVGDMKEEVEVEVDKDFADFAERFTTFLEEVKDSAVMEIDDYDFDGDLDVSLNGREIEVHVDASYLQDKVKESIQDSAEDHFPEVFGLGKR